MSASTVAVAVFMRYHSAVQCTCASESRMFTAERERNRPWKGIKHESLLLAIKKKKKKKEFATQSNFLKDN